MNYVLGGGGFASRLMQVVRSRAGLAYSIGSQNEAGKFPGAIVLDITGGDQTVSRVMARHLAQNGVAALFVQMAYYGPRRPPNCSLRLLSTDLEHSFAAVRQTVLDTLTKQLDADPAKVLRHLEMVSNTVSASIPITLRAAMDGKLIKPGQLVLLCGFGAGLSWGSALMRW